MKTTKHKTLEICLKYGQPKTNDAIMMHLQTWNIVGLSLILSFCVSVFFFTYGCENNFVFLISNKEIQFLTGDLNFQINESTVDRRPTSV